MGHDGFLDTVSQSIFTKTLRAMVGYFKKMDSREHREHINYQWSTSVQGIALLQLAEKAE